MCITFNLVQDKVQIKLSFPKVSVANFGMSLAFSTSKDTQNVRIVNNLHEQL